MSIENRRATRRIAFITGAGAGIGRACARRFAQGGWQVAISDVDASTLVPLRAELGGACIFDAALDVADADAVDAVFARFAQASGQALHLLINNAGVLEMGAFETLSLERQRRINHINNDGLLHCSHRSFPLLAATPGARLVNLSSASANYGVPSLAVYSASKFWVRGFTEALNLEWGRHGIWVCDVMPNFVGTGMLSEHGKDALISRLGIKLGPEDVAEVVWRAATGARRVHWAVEKNPVLRALVAINGALPQGLQRLAMKITTGS
jgi:NAD(P)-dependent dehydrogenase (short-subunit alcohol dehydrogenase family)